MSGNAQKIPTTQSLNEFAERRILSAIELTGRALPASVTEVLIGCVKIKFELTVSGLNLPSVTVPLGGAAGSEYLRLPIQVGAKGVVRPADARLGAVSGLGAANTDLSPPANLSALVFEPIGNKSWDPMMNLNQSELWGPEGALIRSQNKQFYVQVTETGINIQNTGGTVSLVCTDSGWEVQGPIKFHGSLIAMDGLYLDGNIFASDGTEYTGNFQTTGDVGAKNVSATTDVVAGNISLKNHRTSGVQTGGGTSGPPVP